MRIRRVRVVRVPWIPHGMDVVIDCPDGEIPVIWARDDVPERVVAEQRDALEARLHTVQPQ